MPDPLIVYPSTNVKKAKPLIKEPEDPSVCYLDPTDLNLDDFFGFE